MKTLQDVLDGYLYSDSFLRRVAAQVILKGLRRAGFKVDEGFLPEIESKLDTDNLTKFRLQFDDDQVPQHLLASREDEDDGVIELDSARLEEDLDSVIQQLTDDLTRLIPNVAHDMAPRVLANLRRRSAPMLRHRRKYSRSFRKSVKKAWGKAFDLLEMLVAACLEVGEDTDSECPEGETSDCHVLEVLTRLHARACQIASEILVLLQTGHADGAHARWRCLHEVAVVGFFVAKYGDEVAERYLLHDGIERWKAAQQYKEHAAALDLDPITDDEFARMKSARDRLVQRFGAEYGENYGWASTALGRKKPTFADIERKVEMNHLRPYYRLASHNVHANPMGTFFKLGLMQEQEDVLLAGPSDMGLVEPGQGCALSLSQITIALLCVRPNLDGLVICEIIRSLETEVGEAFLEANDSLIENARKKGVQLRY